MKRLITLLTVLLITGAAKAQWPPYYPTDSCDIAISSCEWVHLDTTDTTQLWQIGKVNKPFFGTAFGDSTAIVTDTLMPYATNQNDFFELRIPTLDPNGYGYFNRELHFRHKYQTDSLNDGGYIMVSYDSGATWVNLYPALYSTYCSQYNIMEVRIANLYAESDTLSDGKAAFHGTRETWLESSIAWIWVYPVSPPDGIPADLVPSIWLRFYFESDSIPDSLDGWIIDNIVLGRPFVSVNTLQADKVFDLSPNPVQDALQVQLKTTTPEQVNYSIVNLQGQVLHHDKLNATQTTIDVHNLPQGMYLLQLQGDTWLSTRKFIKTE